MKKVKKMAVGGMGGMFGGAGGVPAPQSSSMTQGKLPVDLSGRLSQPQSSSRTQGVSPIGTGGQLPQPKPMKGSREPNFDNSPRAILAKLRANRAPAAENQPAPQSAGTLDGVAAVAQNKPRISGIEKMKFERAKREAAAQMPKRSSGNPMIQRTAAPGMKAGGKVSSASKRADGCAVRGKTRGKMV